MWRVDGGTGVVSAWGVWVQLCIKFDIDWKPKIIPNRKKIIRAKHILFEFNVKGLSKYTVFHYLPLFW